ncbi:MAG: hypothetical protein ACREF4_21850 [Gammaproteobacteria bacterium]
MYTSLAMVLAALALAVTTAAAQTTTIDATGRVLRVDPGTQVVILDDNKAFRVGPNTVLLVDNQPVNLSTLQPGQAVIIRSGEAVTIAPSGTSTAQAPRSTVVVTQPGAKEPLPPQTIYGRVSDIETGEIKIKTDADTFKLKVPREVAAQLREGDSVRLDLSFQPSR